MFHIRQQHLTDFESDLLARVRKSVGRYLDNRYSAGALPEDKASLARLGNTAVDTAWGYGIQRAEDVQDFVDLTIAHGHQFETLPQNSWMAEILNDGAIEGEEKIARILDRLNGDDDEPADLDEEDEEVPQNEDGDEEAEFGREDVADEADKDDELDARELLDLPERDD